MTSETLGLKTFILYSVELKSSFMSSRMLKILFTVWMWSRRTGLSAADEMLEQRHGATQKP